MCNLFQYYTNIVYSLVFRLLFTYNNWIGLVPFSKKYICVVTRLRSAATVLTNRLFKPDFHYIFQPFPLSLCRHLNWLMSISIVKCQLTYLIMHTGAWIMVFYTVCYFGIRSYNNTSNLDWFYFSMWLL